MSNPFIGVLFHWAGGLASGSFYVPFRGVRRWSWETAWLAGGVFSWIIAPWFFGLLLTKDLVAVLGEAFSQQLPAVGWTYLFGALWGLGGLTFGLTMRYLGMSLGMAVALGYCSTFGTLVPPLFRGEFTAKLITPLSGNWVLAGIAVCIVGIAIAGLAGVLKERGMSAEQKQETIKEFNFWKGLGIATFSGIMSACFSFGLSAGEPINAITKAHGTDAHWAGLPILVVLLGGGFTSNAIWCAILNLRNRSGGEYFSPVTTKATTGGFLNEHGTGPSSGVLPAGSPVPLLANYFWAGLAGVTWYFQFFFYTIGESMMGDYTFTSWTLHMASIIIFSSLWGMKLGEWKGSSPRAFRLLWVAIGVLVLSTIIIGYGNYVGQASSAAAGH
jgi:L-rhamnose-H+ transport protein